MTQVRFEQAVYGSFPFWDRGYAVLAQSPGCRPDWLDEFRAACQRFGERPGSAEEFGGSMFALRLPSGPWAIVGVSSTGADDRGRPGALAFHGLFLRPKEFRKVGFDPFALAGALRRDWGPETTVLPSATRDVVPPTLKGLAGDIKPHGWITAMLGSGRRVALESAGPIDGLARDVWADLPERIRRRASVATWAFGNGNRFDLVALPKLAGVALDASYVTGPDDDSDVGNSTGSRWPRRASALIGAGAIALAAIGLAFGTRGADRPPPIIATAPRPTAPTTVPDIQPPAPPTDCDRPIDPDERARAIDRLRALAERFGVAVVDQDDPSALMVRLSEAVRYRGPFLSPVELERLRDDSSPGRARALAWHEHVRRFAPDRPLPADFDRGPLRWQLDVLAWSFHLEPDARLSAAEVPEVLGESLAVDGPIGPNPLARRYPALGDYERFLAGLPQR